MTTPLTQPISDRLEIITERIDRALSVTPLQLDELTQLLDLWLDTKIELRDARKMEESQ